MTSIGENERGELCQRLANALIADESSDLKPDYLREAISVCLSRAGLAIIPADKLESLSDPTAVHLNMLRGGIAKPSVPNIWHLYGEEALLAEAPEHIRTALTPQEKDGDG
jgi:hypothetical protein